MRPRPDALELFAGWLGQPEGGDGRPFGELLSRHPDVATELEELHATWRRLSEAAGTARSQRSLHAEIVERFGEGADSRVSLHGERPVDPASGFASARLAELAARQGSFGRYEVEGEVARGGMGAILRVWDEDLRRHLAMKVALPDGEGSAVGAGSPIQARTIARFLEEAQVTGQLDHPGIVPVHELGIDSQGRVYFTMKLVEGRDLKQVFALVFEGREGWNETRALGVILKVCEAVAYAHKKGVIHRDLKPANVMVGSFGEVFVMDWGLARVLGRRDTRDIRLAPASAAPGSSARSASDSPLLTIEGDVVGTPAYMPPEQARGSIEELSPRSDVYSIGAMLYHLLARQMPYMPPSERPAYRDVLARVVAGPPRALAELNADVPAELAAICQKAMEREPARRYADTLALAEDLRAFLEHRVVGAYETGAVAELRKWIARNRALASASAAAIVILAVGLIVSLSLYVRARNETARADAKAKEVDQERLVAEQRADDILSLSASKDLQDLIARADALWPPHPENTGSYESWLRDAGALIEGQPADPARGVKARPGLEDHRKKLGKLEARASRDDRWWHEQLSTLIAALEAFSDPGTGLLTSGTDPVHGWGMEKRLEMARTIEARSVAGNPAAQRWSETIASIRDRSKCPKYDGLAITPQIGLIPIGRDPRSGLFEFAHLESGEAPERGPDGKLVLDEGTALVFVLIPGGTFELGAQSRDPSGPNYDAQSKDDGSVVYEIALSPFFLSKYEMTQGQWMRLTGGNPSRYAAGNRIAEIGITALHPVEQVSWDECSLILRRMALVLPTDAQWESACRAETRTPWYPGDTVESLSGHANLADEGSRDRYPPGWRHEAGFADGFPLHAPVGSLDPNPWGLHDMHGNLWEWCRDGYFTGPVPAEKGDGERVVANPESRIDRGGSYASLAGESRSSYRTNDAPDFSSPALGFRPARAIVP